MKKKLWIMVCVAVPLTMVAAIVYEDSSQWNTG